MRIKFEQLVLSMSCVIRNCQIKKSSRLVQELQVLELSGCLLSSCQVYDLSGSGAVRFRICQAQELSGLGLVRFRSCQVQELSSSGVVRFRSCLVKKLSG